MHEAILTMNVWIEESFSICATSFRFHCSRSRMSAVRNNPLAISYAAVMIEWTQHPGFAVSGIIWLFQATAEQPTFSICATSFRFHCSRSRMSAVRNNPLTEREHLHPMRPMKVGCSAVAWNNQGGQGGVQVDLPQGNSPYSHHHRDQLCGGDD
jgi:hypothetical protein